MRRRHAISPVFSGYWDLGISSLKEHDSAYLQSYSYPKKRGWQMSKASHDLKKSSVNPPCYY